ncbi:metal dependent phosphohydrolase [Geobacter metallireducens RCH3]|uniref:Metal-dependent phosphohydrolase, HDOD domain-containing n=1 Tax=Geobacter metallireducens (strain ATCC 53774 / DSM 7210 / GS-15) TaxID=269799 RepID=Q39QJ3_GEOMG|nr:HDOD domain-containing protein [Geobacter metallireducens]ABB33481.1 metal-dependent phosphohydrolase, HDOD domain-containing [Geobacter metallireducens GS-15]EHP87532.1 metal dependent phosphohydrolase [Geobacter metallireducens RCH3]
MEQLSKMEKAAALIRGMTDLPTIPAVATQVLSLLDQPDVEIDQVAELLLTDQVMAARVLKMVNSPLYRPATVITSLKGALVYLGLRHIREFILTCSFIQSFEGKEGVLGVKPFWEHSFGVGIVARLIAAKVGYHDTEKAYIGGLIHDIGEVFLSYYLKDKFQKVVDAIRESPVQLVEAEERILGTTHCEVGLCLAREWHFPDDYCEIVACHHAPREATNAPRLVAIVNLADLFCTVRNLDYGGKEWTSFSLADEPAWAMIQEQGKKLAEFDVERFCYELDDQVEEIRELVTNIFKDR